MAKSIDENKVIAALKSAENQQALAVVFEKRMHEAQDLVRMVENTALSGAARRYLEAVWNLFLALRRQDALDTQGLPRVHAVGG